MSTRNNINADIQVKEINNKRWICQKVKMTDTTGNGDYDFLDNADGQLWKKIRPLRKSDMNDRDISGISQMIDDKMSNDIYDSTNGYMNDDYVDDYFE